MEGVFWDSVLLGLLHGGSSAVTPLPHIPATKAPSRMSACCSGSGSLPALGEPGSEPSVQPGRAKRRRALTALPPPTSWGRPGGRRTYFGDACGEGRREDLISLWLVVRLAWCVHHLLPAEDFSCSVHVTKRCMLAISLS